MIAVKRFITANTAKSTEDTTRSDVVAQRRFRRVRRASSVFAVMNLSRAYARMSGDDQ
jgi:hypothetical protein